MGGGKPVVVITMGDPTGVGPEIIIAAMRRTKIRRLCRPVVLGDEGVLAHVAGRIGHKGAEMDFPIISLSSLDMLGLKPGKPTRACGRAMVSYIREAAYMAGRGEVDAMVTGPINKAAIRKAGCDFPGHTEFLADIFGTEKYAMMLAGKRLKVILVTIHEPIRKVPDLVTTTGVLETIRIADFAFKRYFGILQPRIAVAALNPHAGESGLFGDEEKKVIYPAIRKARREGMDVSDPLPPDTVFFRAVEKGEFDCVVCMYHDQGLIPLKLLHFKDGVNVTLGLPIIRTSVDHGTAYDMAWKGVADPNSMIAAIEMASEMAESRSGCR